MSERKVLNKYYPPDFDPALLPRAQRPKDGMWTIRTMLPMTVCCKSCGEFIYKGKKFNARMEVVKDEDYLGIKIFRQYIKCTRCSQEITFRTDPKNSDYVVEHGATRNFEPWRETEEEKEDREFREQEEAADAMKALEARTKASKREMDILDNLDELRAMNARNVVVDVDELLKKIHEEKAAESEIKLTEDQQAELSNVGDSGFVRRIDEAEAKAQEEAKRNAILKDISKPKIKKKRNAKKAVGFLAADDSEEDDKAEKSKKRKVGEHSDVSAEPAQEDHGLGSLIGY